MSYEYAYITSCLILAIFWFFIFLKRKNLRKEMLWASFWALPFGFIDFFLVPNYWHPDSLFGIMKKYGSGIESFIFIFLMAGIVSVIYEFLRDKKPIKIARANRHRFWLLALTSLTFLIMTALYPTKAVYNLMIAGVLGSIVTACLRKDLTKQMFVSASVFSLIYLGVFILINLMFPGFVQHSYNMKSLWNVFVFGVPFEEIAVAFLVGAFWSTLYEYTKSYRE